MKKILATAACLLLLISCVKETKELSPEAQAVKNSLLLQKELFDAPGIAFGMIVNDTIVYADGHGVQSLDEQDPMTSKSVFHMASVSKPFVATAVAQLIEKGKIDLEGKLIDYLPYFTMDDEWYKDITIKQMLTHTSGIPNTSNYEWDKPQYDDNAAERYARLHKTYKLDFTPGTKYKYSNPAFDILCDVIAKVSGMSFEDYMTANIFEPIGMKNSSFFRIDSTHQYATKPHVIGDSLQRVVSKIYPYNRRHAGSSTLHSNVEDMLLWARMYLNEGTINGKEIFSKETYQLITKVHTPEGMRRSALSWGVGRINGTVIYNHSGGDTGYRTFFGFMPEKKSAVVIMVNSDNFWTENVSLSMLKNTIFKDSVHPKVPIHLKLKDYILTEGIEKTKAVYFAEKEKTPQDYRFYSWTLDNLGYWLMDRKYHDKALDVFKFNVELEPEYPGWPDSVADAYKAMDSIDLAITWYKKALKLKPDQDFTIKKLDELLQKKAGK